MGTSTTTAATTSEADTRQAESRDQLILRRRSAQRAWRTARERVDRAAQRLSTTPHGQPARVEIRDGLENARSAERAARASYRRVAEETGTLLGRLARRAG